MYLLDNFKKFLVREEGEKGTKVNNLAVVHIHNICKSFEI